MDIIYNILLLIDGAIYDLIDYIYDIFNFLAGYNIFSQETYNQIVQRIYVILGMVMLFALAYSLLKAVINPDDFAKGEQSFPNVIKNTVISLVIIAVLPTVFSVVFNVQNAILNNDTTPKLILGDQYTSSDYSDSGRLMAFNVFHAFFHPNAEWCTSKGYPNSLAGLEACEGSIKSDGFLFIRGSGTLKAANDIILNHSASFTNYVSYSKAAVNKEISYLCVVSTVAGAFLLYVLLNFCFDLAVRVIKLMFYQLIAPIPVICRVIPFGSLKDVFNKWLKFTVSAFVEVFIKIAIMYLGVFVINLVIASFGSGTGGTSSLTATQSLIAQALVIMGVVIFIRQAPKLLGDMFGLDSGNMKLGLMDKLAMGGALTAGALAGGLITSGTRNLVAGGKKTIENFKGAQGFRGKASALIKGGTGTLFSGIAGGLSGGARGLYAGRGAKNFSDMKNAASKAAEAAGKRREKRADYKASHATGGGFIEDAWAIGFGHVADAAQSIGDWATAGASNYEQVVKRGQKYKSLDDALKGSADKVITKFGTNANLVRSNMIGRWKGSATQSAEQQAIFTRLGMDRGQMSLDGFDNYIAQRSAPINAQQFMTATGFDQAAYERAQLDQAHEIEILNMMKNQLHKEAQSMIINAAQSGRGIDAIITSDKLLDVNADVENLLNQYSLDGSKVLDSSSGTTLGSVNLGGDVADQLGKVVDAYTHNATIARREAAKREQAKEARGGNKNS